MVHPLVDAGEREREFGYQQQEGRNSLAYSDISSASDATLMAWSETEPKPRTNVSLLDEEERATEDVLEARQPRSRRQLLVRVGTAAPFGIALATMILLVPVLHWLSSAGSAPSLPDPQAVSQAGAVNALFPHQPSSGEDVVTVTLPFYSSPHAGQLGNPHTHADFPPSSIDAQGNWGLGSGVFSRAHPVYDGWSTPAESKAAQSFDVEPPAELKDITMDEIFNGTFTPKTAAINWNKEATEDGVYTFVDEAGDVVAQDVVNAQNEKEGKKHTKKILIRKSEVKDPEGEPIEFDSYTFSPDLRYAILTTDRTKHWRHSTFFSAYLYDREAKTTRRIAASKGNKLSLVRFVPFDSPGVIFVSDRDLYFIPSPAADVVRLTTDGEGSQTIFNASPDWVYEEEVLESDSALWLSPSGTQAVFLRLDETAVPIYSFPLYNPKDNAGATPPYPGTVDMKYPKPGYPNPTVSTYSIDLGRVRSLRAAHPSEVEACKLLLTSPAGSGEVDDALSGSEEARANRLVTEVVWLGEELLVRETDRTSSHGRVLHFDLTSPSSFGSRLEGKVVRRLSAGKDGWLDIGQTAVWASSEGSAYVEVAPDDKGFRHIAFYASGNTTEPHWLTSGNWEVDGGVSHVDLKRNRVYFTAAYPSPSTRQVYFTHLPSAGSSPKQPTALTEGSRGWNSVLFDPKGAYYLHVHEDPNTPPTYTIRGVDKPFSLVLEDNAGLASKAAEYKMPSTVFYNITLPDGSMSTVKELRPHDFALGARRTPYPVLINVYGGPGSQLVQQRWARAHMHHYLTSTLGYVVTTVDGVGTGYRGTSYRAPVARNLGAHEANVTIAAASILARLPYVDASRMGIWGWSYGGYLTSKVIEADVDNVLSLGMAVAPVTKWSFYDSVYTERYEGLPQSNKDGYTGSDVHVSKAFHTHSFALAHGSGDDNVHLENSAHLLDLLTEAKVRNYQFRMFTDSDHGINTRGAYPEIHHFLMRFLVDNWGAGGRRRLALLPPP